MIKMGFKRFYTSIISFFLCCILLAGCVSRKKEIIITENIVPQTSPLKSGEILSAYIYLPLKLTDGNVVVFPELVLTNCLGKTTETIAKELDEALEKIQPRAEVRVVR